MDYSRTPTWVVHQAASLWWLWTGALLLLIPLYRSRRAWPEGFAGIGIFVVALAPVLGMVPFEFQGYSTVADRYVYIPMLGIALAAAGLLDRIRDFRWLQHRPDFPAWFGGGAILGLGALSVLTWLQVGVWRDSAALFGHAVAVVPRSGFGWQGLAHVREQAGDLPGAVPAYRRAVSIRPDDLQALTGVYRTLREVRPDRQAEDAYAAVTFQAARRVLLKFPNSALAHRKMGTALAMENRPTEAAAEFQQSIAEDPRDPATRSEFAQLLAATGRPADAAAQTAIARSLQRR